MIRFFVIVGSVRFDLVGLESSVVINRSALKSGVSIWLIIAQIWVILIICVGAITRLTESGLSMVDWTLVVDMVPPRSHADWMAVFSRYQQFPEFQLKNMMMTLSEFKWIYFWEYLHRLLGRGLGLLFVFPYMYFAFTRQLSKRQHLRLLGLVMLGAVQAFMGWYMVKSGLVHNPQVSHFRLAAHLSIALLILSGLFYTWIKTVVIHASYTISAGAHLFFRICFGIFCLQIVYGAFMAGLDAGYISTTYPLLLGEYVPSVLGSLPFHDFWFWNTVSIHFIHRTLGLILMALILIGGGVFLVRETSVFTRSWIFMLMLSVVFQFSLGVLTILSGMSIGLAVLHQLGAVLLLLVFLLGFAFTDR